MAVKKVSKKIVLKSGSCEIHELEYLTSDYNWCKGEQLVLAILQEKGAPVSGVLHFKPDELNYDWVRYKNGSFDRFYWNVKENLPQ